MQKDGRTLAAHLKVAAKRDRRAAAELAGPPFPQGCAYVWTWFCEISTARPWSPHGPQALSFAELAAWAQLTGRRLEPWEVELLRAVDAAWLAPATAEGGGDGDRRNGQA